LGFAPGCSSSAWYTTHLVCRDRPGKSLQLKLTEQTCLNSLLDSSEDALPGQDLPCIGVRAEARREVGDGPKGAVVVTAFEADPAEGGIARLDAHPEPELNPALRRS
jgi:hypothetical protein